MGEQMIINAFTQCSVVPQSKGQWKNPRDQSSRGYTDIEFWIDLARTYERGCVDAMFFADIHGVYDVYGGNMDAGVRHAVQFPGNDPTMLAALLARETKHMGFIFTYSTTYFPPFHTAKLFSSLDHFTNGRVGWNIVTSYLESAYKNGLGGKPLEHDARYEQAEEYMEVVYKLWEHSWDEDAVVRDMANDVHTDPSRVHTIDHHGEHYTVQGPHMCEPSPQRTPFLVQAGQSPRGLAFGTKHAEALFVGFRNVADAAAKSPHIRDLAEAAGRERDSVKLLKGINLVVGETEREAKLKYEEMLEYASPEGALALFGGWTGVDLAGLDAETPLGAFESNGMQHIAKRFEDRTGTGPNGEFTFGDLSKSISIGSMNRVTVGTPAQIADTLEEWVDVGGIDGFNMIPCTQPGSATDLVDMVIPELQRRGRFKTEYAGATLREHFVGPGHARLDPKHRAFDA